LVILARVIAESELVKNRSALEISSYLLLFPFALIGVSILNIALWKTGGYRLLGYKVIGALILLYVAYLTFGPHMRFQFLGWMAGAAIIIAINNTRKNRLIILGGAAVLGIAAFAVAGSMRDNASRLNETGNPALERFVTANDANMLDGFVLLEQVYPDRLGYTWGMDHVEILLRPIPRSLWPDKPVGGYANRLGFNDYDEGITTISPSLFGSFYAEGGLVGIVILSIIYGAGLAKIMSYSIRLQPFACLILRAVLCASLVPMLRGGDIAGSYAWIGMAYWPCFLLLWWKRKSLRINSTPAVVRPGRLQYRIS
jgi:oligosaccharide repeat unit polymerase